jgi:serine/threonine protein kinase
MKSSHSSVRAVWRGYRARDTQLNRDVAIKILPELFSADADRVARFQREAQLLASLNHPNIAHIYGLERAGDARALVLELVDGPTLADRIVQGPIPIDEALPIARQIAEALEAAHEQGIIHRDLKPANVKLTLDGKVKVFDFGLAKMLERASTGSSLSMSPTLSVGATYAGVILGTAAYMSPEQARGKPVDRRTDIWAFGCVLFEMLTGKQTFETGETVSDAIAAILTKDPGWRLLPKDLPPNIDALLHRCLQKDPQKRLPHIGVARLELDDLAAEAHLPRASARDSRRTRERVAWVAALVCAAGVPAALMFAISRSRQLAERPEPLEMRVDINTPVTSEPMSFAISPDGRRLVFVASGDGQARLWVRSLDSLTATPLSRTEGATYPFWSPDGRTVGFFADAKLKRVDVEGGRAQTLVPSIGVPRGAAWGPGDVILFSSGTSSPLFRISASGGPTAVATAALAPRESGQSFPRFLPDGRRFVFFTGTEAMRGIYLGSLDSRTIKRLGAADAAAAYVSPGWLAFVRHGALVAQQIDLSREELVGEPVTIAGQIGFDTNSSAAAFSVSAAGTVYRVVGFSRRQLAWFDRSGKPLGVLGPPDDTGLIGATLSPDGRRAAVHRTVDGNTDVWVSDANRMTRFTFDASNDQYPVWSPDGKWIAFDSNRSGVRNLYRKLSNGAGAEERLLQSTDAVAANSFSPDGRFLAFTKFTAGGTADLGVLPLEGERKPIPFITSDFDERGAQFSPDGRWIAYQSNESGRYDIFVRPFPGPGGQWQVSTLGGIQVRWRRDGKELYYIAPDGGLMAVPIAVNGATLEPGPSVRLFQTRIWGGGTNANQRQQYDVAPDGRFLINVTTEDERTSPITLLLNWKPPAPPRPKG